MEPLQGVSKRKYHEPEFRAYGDLRKLTESDVTGPVVDMHPSGNKKTT